VWRLSGKTALTLVLLGLLAGGWGSTAPAQEPAEEVPAESATPKATPAELEAASESTDPGADSEADEEAADEADSAEAASNEATGDEAPGTPEAEEPKLVLPKRLAPEVPKELRPEVEVLFVADAESRLLADGVELGILPAGEKRRVVLRTGDHWIKARSVRFPGALWDRVISVREDDARPIEIKMLKSIRDLHRHERQTKTYRAPKSDLMWARQDNGGDVRWDQAVAHCEQLVLGGYEDWRLPSLEELRTIRALWSVATFKILGGISLTACCPWSADLAEGEGKAWNFNFVHRRPFLGHVENSFGSRALCVRVETEEDRLRDEAAAAGDEPASEAGAVGEVGEGGEGFR